MRVLVVTSLYLSGNGNWVAEQVRSLRDIGLHVDVDFVDTKRTRLNYALSIPRVAGTIKSGQYDIVHTHHTYTFFDVLIARGLSGARTPIILTNHEGEILDRDGRTLSWHPSSHLRNWLGAKRYAARHADFVVFVAPQLASVLGFNGRHAVIPCGVDLSKYRPLDQAECRRHLGISETAVVVFFPGNPRNLRKRFSLAQDALGLVRREVDDVLMLTGGAIPADEMPLYYNAADVVLQTSYFEASPTVVKEALGCEVPVVSTDAGDSREVVDGVEGCAICDEDPVELAKFILKACGRRAHGARRLLLERELDLVQVARRLVGVYEQVLKTPTT